MLSVNRLFAEELGFHYPLYPFTYKVIDYMKACVGIHNVFCETYSHCEMFHRIENFHIFMHSDQLIWKADVKDIDATTLRQLTTKGYSIDSGTTPYVWTTRIIKHPHHISYQNYCDLSQKLRDLGVWFLTTGDEYRFYISAIDYPFPPELIIYNIMFYFGSITRYHPYQFDKLLSAKEQWMVEVFMRTQPQQFVYGLLSRLIGKRVEADKTATLTI